MALSGLVMVISTDVLDVVLGVLLCYLLRRLCVSGTLSLHRFPSRGAKFVIQLMVVVEGIDISSPLLECVSGDFT